MGDIRPEKNAELKISFVNSERKIKEKNKNKTRQVKKIKGKSPEN